MPNFKLTNVDSRLLNNVAGDISNEIDNLNIVNRVLNNEIISNLSPYWQGAAKDSFDSQFIVLIENYHNLLDELERMTSNLKTSAGTYESADNFVKQAIDKIYR